MSGFDTLSSDWDQSLAYLIRLDNCCQALNAAKFEGPDYELWIKALWAFYLELSSNLYHEVRETDRKKARKRAREEERDPDEAEQGLVSEQDHAERLIQRAENGVEVSNLSEMDVFRRFIQAEKYLRSKMRERGLLVKLKHDPGLALATDKSY